MSSPGQLRFGRVGADLGDEVVAVVVEASPNPPRWRSTATAARRPSPWSSGLWRTRGAERCRQPVAWIRHASRSTIAAEAEVDLMRGSHVPHRRDLARASPRGVRERDPPLSRAARPRA